MTAKIAVTLTQKQAEMLLDAIAYRATMYEQGDMEGMKTPAELRGDFTALQNARSAIYAGGFRWDA